MNKNLEDAFKQYDDNSSSTISSSDEAQQLTLNIVFALGWPVTH